MQDGTANLKDIEVLILDEVDRMLDMGFLPDVRRIVERTPKERQTLVFSATMPPQIQNLADFALKEPVSIEVGIRFSPAETVSHYMYPVAGDQRQELLMAILKQTHFDSARTPISCAFRSWYRAIILAVAANTFRFRPASTSNIKAQRTYRWIDWLDSPSSQVHHHAHVGHTVDRRRAVSGSEGSGRIDT